MKKEFLLNLYQRSKTSFLLFGVLILPLLIGLWLRFPYINNGLPFFYQEDEAHHFNRVVRMTQQGNFDPQYFHKPSLHFYLRMPVVAAAFLWSVRKGEMRSIQEVRTEDSHGLAGYNFTASHARIVSWNRALSVLFALGSVALTMYIVWLLSSSLIAVVATGVFAAVVPTLISHSAIIGVDMPMMFFCMASVTCALVYSRSYNFWHLIYASILAGFAVSTKYNALPIFAVPIITAYFTAGFSLKALLVAILAPLAAFFVASPYILSSLPLFLDQFAYEIWHYGVAGHEGHTGDPGLGQALFFLRWLANDAVGYIGLGLSFIGLLYFFLQQRKDAIIVFIFPILLFLLMSMQRANFERNLLSIVPFVVILLIYGLFSLYQMFSRFLPLRLAFILIALSFTLVFARTAARADLDLQLLRFRPESRYEVFNWLHELKEPYEDTVIAAQLQLPRFTKMQAGELRFSKKGVERLDSGITIGQHWLNGFKRVVLSAARSLNEFESSLVDLELEFKGRNTLDRIVQNPKIQVYKFKKDAFNYLLAQGVASELPSIKVNSAGNFVCDRELAQDDFCWINKKLAKLEVTGVTPSTLNLELMSPWPKQKLSFMASGKLVAEVVFESGNEGNWIKRKIPVSSTSEGVYVLLEHIHSPFTQELSKDKRRLGVAFR